MRLELVNPARSYQRAEEDTEGFKEGDGDIMLVLEDSLLVSRMCGEILQVVFKLATWKSRA